MRFWFAGFIMLIQIESCCRYNESYHVSDYGKSWIVYAGTAVSFKNDMGDIISFNYSPAATGSFEGSHGEECGDYCYIDEITFSLTELSIDFAIDAENSCYGSEGLNIICEKSPLYQFSLTNDTVYANNPVVYHNNLSINGKEFEMVYEVDSIAENPSSLVKCFLTKVEGIVGYETTDGRTWNLQ